MKFSKKIRNYALASFLVPLIAINSCLLIYKYLGGIDVSLNPNFDWSKNELSYTFKEYNQVSNNLESHTFTNCSKYDTSRSFNYIDNQTLKTIEDTIENYELIQNMKKL